MFVTVCIAHSILKSESLNECHDFAPSKTLLTFNTLQRLLIGRNKKYMLAPVCQAP